MTDLSATVWRKSTHFGGNGGSCVEVADNLPDVTAVRDSKDQLGPVLTFSRNGRAAFIESTKSGTFDQW